MARTSNKDPLDRFRFQVTILEDPKLLLSTDSATFNDTAQESLQVNRAGFSEATLPKVTVSEVLYRENIDGFSFRKIAGLSRYEPIALRRGAVDDRELYNWFKMVNNEAGSLNTFSEGLASGFGIVPYQEANYRKDILISSMDRTGKFIKHWFISNAFPTSYKGGNDFDAQTDGKLIEELVLAYDFFLEIRAESLDEALRKARAEGEQAAQRAVASAAIGAVTGLFGGG